MKFTSTILFTLASAQYAKGQKCLSSGDQFDIVDNGCDLNAFEEALDEYLATTSCGHGAKTELRHIFGSQANAERAVANVCENGWSRIDTTTFRDVDSRFTNSFMNEYVTGGTFLNTETGTFQGTTEGNNIGSFRGNEATNTAMQGFPSLSNCQYQSIMCCFGRDRQPNDNNGNCADPIDENCLDADPADNSNLCHVNTDHISTFSDPFLFPNNSEGAIHCHGLAWADDSNDFTAQLKYNNFFFVSLYDHMYQRGYVETTVDSDDIAMCGCIEEMPQVSRSDCTQIDATQTFEITFKGGTTFTATPSGDLDIEYNACQGTNPVTGRNKNNDLASYVNRLNIEGDISDSVKDKVFDVLVGYTNVNDNNNEAACVAAYEEDYGTYPDTTKIEDNKCHNGGSLFRTEDNNPISLEECQELCYNTDKCEHFAFGLDSAPQHRGVCMGCEASNLSRKNGFNAWKMTDTQNFPTSVAVGKPTTQSNTSHGGVSSRAVDGNANGIYANGSVTHTREMKDPSWSVELEGMYEINNIKVFNRQDSCCTFRLSGFKLIIWRDQEEVYTYTHSGGTPSYLTDISVPNVSGDKVEIMLPGNGRVLSLAEVEVFGDYLGSVAPSPAPPTNFALGKPTTQSKTTHGGVSSRAVDGDAGGRYAQGSVTHTPKMTNPSWSVDLESLIGITSVNVYNRQDSCCTFRLSGFKLIIWRGIEEVFTFTQSGGTPEYLTTVSVPDVAGDKVEIVIPGTNKVLSLAEVEVFGELLGTSAPTPSPPTNFALGKPTTQSKTTHGGVSSRAVDGNTNGRYAQGSVTHTPEMTNPSWSVDLESMIGITSVNVYNRQDSCCTFRLSGFKLIIWRGIEEVFTFTQSGGTPEYLTTVSVPDVAGDKVEIVIPGAKKVLSLTEVEVFGELLGTSAPTPSPPENLALGRPATQSRTAHGGLASRAVDGNTNGRYAQGSVTHTPKMTNPSWSVDLGSSQTIGLINVYNRQDSCCTFRLSGFKVIIWNGNNEAWTFTQGGGTPSSMTAITVPSVTGDKVEIMLPGANKVLSLAEVEVFGPL